MGEVDLGAFWDYLPGGAMRTVLYEKINVSVDPNDRNFSHQRKELPRPRYIMVIDEIIEEDMGMTVPDVAHRLESNGTPSDTGLAASIFQAMLAKGFTHYDLTERVEA